MRALLILACLLSSTASLDARAVERTARRDPRELGRVAILPFLDLAGDSQEAKSEYRETALDEVAERFRKHGIAYVGRAEMDAALGILSLVPTDEEDRTKARLGQLADYLQLRYVVTGVVLRSGAGFRRRGAFGEEMKVGDAKVQFRVYDAAAGRYAEDLESVGTSTARAENNLQRSNKLRVKAVRDATKKSMALFLKPYPKLFDDDPGER